MAGTSFERTTPTAMSKVDVVVVSYNSRSRLLACVEPLCRLENVNVIVVDNASRDGSLEALANLPVTAIGLDRNDGFAAGCNVGWRAGNAPFVLFLNPDATLEEPSLRRLMSVLEDDAGVGAVAPRIMEPDGSFAFSRRRFPGLRLTFAQALFLHRVFPLAEWSDEVIRDVPSYSHSGPVDWVPGACFLVRRALLEELAGFDEEFFLYREDTDLCLRIWRAGHEVRYEAGAVAVHEGGASSPRTAVYPLLAASRILYARKHSSRLEALLDRIGIMLGALSHSVISQGGWHVRCGHVRALKVAALPAQVGRYVNSPRRERPVVVFQGSAVSEKPSSSEMEEAPQGEDTLVGSPSGRARGALHAIASIFLFRS